MISISGKIEGLAECIATLKDLPDKLQRKVLRKALTRGTKPILLAARANARKIEDTGALAKSITRVVRTYVERGVMVVVFGPRTGATQMLVRKGKSKPVRVNPAYYAHLVEFGVRPHAIGRGVHPGTKPSPFLRPAFDANKDAAMTIIAEEVRIGLEAILAKE